VPGQRVLDGVDFDVVSGEIQALLGENGAGKTTLMNVLAGLVRPDAGRLELGGYAIDPASYGPAAAIRAGVRMVHQRSVLVPAMTVAENLAFGDERAGPLFRPRRARAAAAALARRFDLEVPLDRSAGELSPGQRQRAEILRALDRGASVLILDEPTAVLTPGEAVYIAVAGRPQRWGDFAAANRDPVDPADVWLVAQYAKADLDGPPTPLWQQVVHRVSFG